MSEKYDIYIDESCHLENDNIPIMTIGYIKVPKSEYKELWEKLKNILESKNQTSELKWNKFSRDRLNLYKRLVDFFFESPLEFRCVLIKYKDRLNHKDFNQGSHDNYYYKIMYFLLRRPYLEDNIEFRVFIDVKDTRGREKISKLKEVLDTNFSDKSPFTYFQHIHSQDNLFIQLADFFIGAIAYNARVIIKDIENPVDHKIEFIKYLEEKSGFDLNEGTVPWEKKFNIFDHQPKKRD